MKITFDSFILSRVVLELRFDDGFLYWDNCGKTISLLRANNPKLKWFKTDVELATLKIPEDDFEFVFNYKTIRLIQSNISNLSKFKEACMELVPIVVNQFGIKKFKRIGNRFIYIVKTETLEESEEIIKNIPIIKLPESKLKLFGTKIEKPNCVFTIAGSDLNYRFEITSVKRNEIPKNYTPDALFQPEFALLIDIDVFSEKPIQAEGFLTNEFVHNNNNKIINNLIDFIKP